MHGPEDRQGLGQHVGTAHPGEGEVQNAHVPFQNVRQLHVEIRLQPLHAGGVLHVPLPGVGQHVFVPQLAEELQPQLTLQRDQKFAEGGLRDVQGLGGLGDVLVLGDGQHVVEFPEIHGDPSFFPS